MTKSLLAFLLIWIRLAITANATDSSHQVSIVWSCKPILPTSLVDLLEPRDDDEEESEEEQDDEVILTILLTVKMSFETHQMCFKDGLFHGLDALENVFLLNRSLGT